MTRGNSYARAGIKEAVRFALHCATGLLAVIAHWGVMWALLKAGSSPILATSIGFLAGAVTKFYLSYHHVFEPESTIARSGAWFVLALAVQFVLNGAAFLAYSQLVSDVWIAQALTTISVTFFNYLMYRLWVFR